MTQLIYKKIADIMKEIGPIKKSGQNQAQNYKFRGIDQVYNELNPILAKHEVFTIPEVLADRMEERTSKNGATIIYRILTMKYIFYATDGSFVAAIVIGEGMDSGDKASNKAMAVAHKYALMQIFCIPTDDPKDPEHDSHEILPKNSYSQTAKPVYPDPNISIRHAANSNSVANSGDYIVSFGRHKGMPLSMMKDEDIRESMDYWVKRAEKENKPLTGIPLQFFEAARAYLAAQPGKSVGPMGIDDDLPF